MSQKAQKPKRIQASTLSRVHQAGPDRGRPMLVPAALAAAAILVVAAVALTLSNGRSPASTAVASGNAAPKPITAATSTSALAALKPAPAQQKLAQGKTAVTAQDGVIKLAVSDVSDGQAHFYTYESAGKTIAFFVLKGADGVIRAAFDACDVCFPAKKGYHQEGDVMVCNNCGTRFPSVKINVETGGCNPAPLVDQTAGSVLTIQVAQLEAGAKYF